MLAAHIAALGELCTRLCERLRVQDGGGQPGRAGPGCGGRWGCAAGLPASLLAAEDGREKSHLGCVCVHEGALYAQLRKPLCLLLILRIPPPPPERSQSSVLGQGSPSLPSPLCPSVNFTPASTLGSISRRGKEKRSEGRE